MIRGDSDDSRPADDNSADSDEAPVVTAQTIGIQLNTTVESLDNTQHQIGRLVDPLLEQVASSFEEVGRLELWLYNSRDIMGSAACPLQMVAFWQDQAYITTIAEGSEASEGAFAAVKNFEQEGTVVAAPGSGLAGALATEATQSRQGVRWRRLRDMAEDPELPYDMRTFHSANLFEHAGAVQLPNGLGALLVLTKAEADPNQAEPGCMSREALPVLVSAAQVLSGIADLAAQRQSYACGLLERRPPLRSESFAIRGVHNSIQRVATFSREASFKKPTAPTVTGDQSAPGAEEQDRPGWLLTYVRKWLGTGGIPTPMGNCTSFAWTWTGVCISLLLLSALNMVMVESTEDHFLLIASVGALNTLVFGAPNAPLSQPRNIIFGHIIGAVVAILFSYISSPDFYVLIPQWVAVALAPATAIALMGKLGVLHPPAGAACLIYISAAPGSMVAELGWMYVLTPVLASSLLTMAVGILWNNLCPSRQYPIYW